MNIFWNNGKHTWLGRLLDMHSPSLWLKDQCPCRGCIYVRQSEQRSREALDGALERIRNMHASRKDGNQ